MSERCGECGADIISMCLACGAPTCCPMCCKIDSLTAENQELKRLLEAKPNVCSSCGNYLGFLAESECPNCDKLKVAVEALKSLIRYAENQTCTHDETYRGGAIWEICSMCDAKWADDEGGKPEDAHELPREILEADEALAKIGGD